MSDTERRILFERRCRAAAVVRAAVVASVLVATTGCDINLPGKPNPADRPLPTSEVTNFAQLFKKNCSGCHGAEGELGPAPPLNDPLFLQIIPDEELVRVITSGRGGTPMPAFATSAGGTLTNEQVKILAAGIKSTWQAKEDDAVSDGEVPAYSVSRFPSLQLVPASVDVAAGAEVFARACVECHGPNGAGGETGYTSGGAINDAAFLALISDQALRRIIITGRPDLGMPTYAESDGRSDDFEPLSETEVDELVALLASWRRPDGLKRGSSENSEGK